MNNGTILIMKSIVKKAVFLVLCLMPFQGFAEATVFYFSPVKNAETRKVQKGLKKNKYFDQVIYMFEDKRLETFSKEVKDGDTIEIHADGIPWVMGAEAFKENLDHNPFSLAQFFSKWLANKDIELIIDLRFCTSGVQATGPHGSFIFAQDFSAALKEREMPNITVYGYSGYINAKSAFKQSLAEFGTNPGRNRGSKFGHCTLEQGRSSYKNGVLLEKPEKELSTITYTEDEYQKDQTLQKYLAEKKDMLSTSKLKDKNQ